MVHICLGGQQQVGGELTHFMWPTRTHFILQASTHFILHTCLGGQQQVGGGHGPGVGCAFTFNISYINAFHITYINTFHITYINTFHIVYITVVDRTKCCTGVVRPALDFSMNTFLFTKIAERRPENTLNKIILGQFGNLSSMRDFLVKTPIF